MQLNGLIYSFSNELKLLIGAFIIVLSIGFFTGLLFVGETSSANPNGIEEQYLGNEYDEDADTKWCPSQESRTLSPVHYALTYRFTARVYLMYPLAGHDKTQVEPLV